MGGARGLGGPGPPPPPFILGKKEKIAVGRKAGMHLEQAKQIASPLPP